jgi:hypothetical protein
VHDSKKAAKAAGERHMGKSHLEFAPAGLKVKEAKAKTKKAPKKAVAKATAKPATKTAKKPAAKKSKKP